jgi:radical SAM protein with 4Fe4S-binding SPASM domain
MNPSLFKRIIDECVLLGIKHVTIFGIGEPLLDPDFASKVAYAKNKGIAKVTTSTNGTLLTETLGLQLIEANLDEICVSIDATSQEIYEKVRGKMNLKTIEENVQSLIKLKRKFNRNNPVVEVNFVESDINKNETKTFIAKWRGVADFVSISKLHNWAGDIETKDYETMRDPCLSLWMDMIISVDGRVALCCVDYENRVTLGNLNEKSIKEIWNGETLRKIREHHKRKEFEKISVCTKCQSNYHFTLPWWILLRLM